MQFLRSTFGLAFLGSLLFWMALPPFDLGLLAWVAPLPWVLLVQKPELTGRRPYLKIYLAYFLFWLAALHWLTLPHWATVFGLIALAFYLAFYLPVFVGLTRVCVQGWRMPAILAAPLVWVGLELIQSYLLTGFTMVVLGQTQYRWIKLIQIADMTGTFGLSFLIVFVAACLAQVVGTRDRRKLIRYPSSALAAILVVVGYGWWRTSGEYTTAGPTVALIQGDIDTELKADPAKNILIFDEYLRLTARALKEAPETDLIVWPETMFRYPWLTFADDYKPKPTDPYSPETAKVESQYAIEKVVLPINKSMLIGIDRWHTTNEGFERYNTALFVDRNANILGNYAKSHLVMFGEYVPFANQFPFLYKLTPLAAGSQPGKAATAVDIGGVCYSPSICFETTLARVMRRLVNEARANKKGCNPQVLVNLTNDGWFWGSAELDMHLICGVFRAIECRKPLLVAANTGFSAWIDSDGRIVKQGKRRAEDVIIAKPRLDQRGSFYLEYGDVFALPCFLVTLAAIGDGLRRRRKAGATVPPTKKR